jgi:hypothetical protein
VLPKWPRKVDMALLSTSALNIVLFVVAGKGIIFVCGILSYLQLVNVIPMMPFDLNFELH